MGSLTRPKTHLGVEWRMARAQPSVTTRTVILAVLMASPAGAQCNFETVAGFSWIRCGGESHQCTDRGSHYVCKIERDNKGTPFAGGSEVWIMKRPDGSIPPQPQCNAAVSPVICR